MGNGERLSNAIPTPLPPLHTPHPLMKRAIAIISFYVLALLFAMLPLQQTDAPGAGSSLTENPSTAPPSPTPKRGTETPETRALWVVRTTMTSPDSVREL